MKIFTNFRFRPLHLWFILLLGLGLRFLFLITPHMDSDQAVTGLMGRHILGGEFPFFFYGQDYCGSIEAYLASTVFLFIGATRFTLNLTICLESLFFILCIYFLARTFFDQETAHLSALFSALASYYLIFHSVLARAAYIEIPIFGALIFILAHKIIYGEAKDFLTVFLLGFFCGLGIWTHFLIIFYLPPVFLFWFIRDPWFWKKQGVLFLLLGLILGGLPLWAHNIAHPLVTWYYLLGTAGGEEGALSSFKDFFINRFPEALGVLNNDTGKFILPYLSFFTYLLYLAIFLYLITYRRKGFLGLLKFNIKQTNGLDLLLFSLILFPIIFSLSGFASAHTSRYLQPIFVVLPILFAVFTRKVRSFSLVLAFLFLSLHLFSNVYGTLTRLPLISQKEFAQFQQARENDRNLFAFLEKRHIRHLYTMEYWDSLRLTFDAQEEILVSQPVGERYPLYADLIDRDPHPGFLFKGDPRDFEETLKNMGGTYQKEQVSNYRVYYGFKPPPYQFTDLEPSGWKVISNYNESAAKAIFDRDLNTQWSSLTPKNSDAFIQIDLGSVVPDIGRLTLFFGKQEETPKGLRLEISVDGRKWQVVRETSGFWNALFWSGPHPFYRPQEPRADLTFPPQPARFIKLTQFGRDPVHFWSLSECFLYQAHPRKEEPFEDVSKLASFLKPFPPAQIFATPWTMAQLPLAWRTLQRKTISDPEKEGQVQIFLNPVFAVEKEEASALIHFFDNRFKGPYEKREISGRLVFTLPNPSRYYQPLSPRAALFQTNYNQAESALAADGKLNTRWTTGQPQRPGAYFQVDLEKEEAVARLSLLVGNSKNDFPRGYDIYASKDGRAWEPLNSVLSPVNLHWTGETLVKGGPDLDFVFPPTRLRYLKIVQTGSDPVYYWSIHEIELYRRAGVSP